MTELWNIVNILGQWKNGKGIVVHSVGEIFCSGVDVNTGRHISNPSDGFKMSTAQDSTASVAFSNSYFSAGEGTMWRSRTECCN